jgi:hypothetical protein
MTSGKRGLGKSLDAQDRISRAHNNGVATSQLGHCHNHKGLREWAQTSRLALLGLEAWVNLVDDIDPALTAHDLTRCMAGLQ